VPNERYQQPQKIPVKYVVENGKLIEVNQKQEDSIFLQRWEFVSNFWDLDLI